MTWVAVAIAGGAIVGGMVQGGASRSAANKQYDAAMQANQLASSQFQQTRSDLMPWANAGNVGLQSLMNLSGMGAGPLGVAGGPVGQQPSRDQFTTYKNTITGYTPRGDTSGGQWTDVYSQGKPIYSRTPVFDQAGYDAAMQNWQGAAAPAAAGMGMAGLPPGQQLAAATANSPLLAPFSLADFQQSPAYQFNLQQGLDAINKQAAARGNYYAPQTLQDVGRFSQGLASNEFNNAYNMYGQNQANVWNRLFGLSGTGQNAAVQTGAFGANAANVMGQNTIGAGNAQAAGIVGQANAITGAGSDIYNAWLTNQILRQGTMANQAPMYGAGQAPAVGMGWTDPYGYGVG